MLVLNCRKTGRTRIGKLGTLQLRPGYYLYVGSARGPGGINARVNRHRRRDKKRHWHIDYLRRHTALVEVWLQTGDSLEHGWAAALAARYPIAMPRFGASDCRCNSHLFWSAGRPGPNALDTGLEVTVY